MKRISLLLCVLLPVQIAFGQVVKRYDLFVNDTMVNYSGKSVMGISINGEIPGPTLRFELGDTAEIHVHNLMKHETSIHWHGLLLPNEQDGVPYLTTLPVKAGGVHVFRFPIIQTGTYWYHSHTMLQEQLGMYGAFIITEKGQSTEKDEVVLLSDWSNENPKQIERSLHYATDWYMIKKKAVQSYGEAVFKKSFGTKLANEFKRMHAMDVSDVYYEAFLANGKREEHFSKYKKGDTLRVRIINGSSSTYFWVHFAGGQFKVVASDGMDVEPISVDRFIVGVSESYDIEIVLPEDGAFELAATSEDRIGAASTWIGSGDRHPAQPLQRLDYFAGMKMMNDMMTVSGNMNDMGMQMSLQKMDMNMVMYPEIMHPETEAPIVTLNYNMLRATSSTKLKDTTWSEYHFELTGNMNRYVWTVNNRTISESDKIYIRKGENVRMIITNNSMMRHPMHLHGHFFRVLNAHGDYSPLKNVLDIMPMETDTIEFSASENYGDWYFHCHILYHMMSGMGRIFSYADSPPNPQIMDTAKMLKMVYMDDRRFYVGSEISVESNGTDGEVSLMNTRWKAEIEWRFGWNSLSGYETESHIGRFVGRNQFLYVYTGWDWRYREGHDGEKNIFGMHSTKNSRGVAHFGIQYTLPLLIVLDASIDHTGYVRLGIKREDIPLTNRLRMWASYNTDNEYSLGLKYILTKYVALSTHYDSDMGFGAGFTFTY